MPQWYEKQIGPLPAGIWVGVVAAGVGVSVLVNRKQKSSATSAPATDGLTSATDGAFGSIPAGVNLGGVVALPGGIPAGQTPAGGNGSTGIPITDNVQWLRTATNMLIAKGYDPVLVDSALRAYLQGQTPTASQQAVVSLALQLLGAPPFPVTTLPPPPPPVTQPPPPVTKPPPVYNPPPVYQPPPPVYTPPPTYGPIYPASATGQAPAGTRCPSTAPILVQGATGYTCATLAQYNLLKAYLGV